MPVTNPLAKGYRYQVIYMHRLYKLQQTFDGKLVLITGGSRGIGFELARQLAPLGASVWMAARRPELLSTAQAEVEALRVNGAQRFGTLRMDISDWDQVEAGVKKMTAQVGLPDYLINSAGVVHPAYIQDQTLRQYRWMMDINYFGAVHMIKALLPDFLKRGSGHIVNLASLAAVIAPFGYTAYAGSKFALRGFTDALRSELYRTPVKVSLVLPADTQTPSLEEENQLRTPEMRAFSEGNAKPVPPQRTAADILWGIARKHYLIFSGTSGFLFDVFNLAGRLSYPILNIFIDQAYRATRIHPDRYQSSKE